MLEDLTDGMVVEAWERVRDNAGGPGVDGVTISGFAQSEGSLLPELRQQLLTQRYLSLPLRQILVRKRSGSTATRTLLVPTVRDRVAETAVARLFRRHWEEDFVESSFAYRPGRGVDSAVARILQLRDRGYTSVLDADIVAYFDNIPHGPLLKLLEQESRGDEILLSHLKQWVKTAAWDGRQLRAVRRGIPQGSPLSPLLANLYLTPLDVALTQGDHRLVRYADDFLVLCRDAGAAAAAMEVVRRSLGELGLELHPDKTRLTNFAEGFRFLGVRFGEAEPLIPWKQKDRSSRVVFIARPMPQRLLRQWRAERNGRFARAAAEEAPPQAKALPAAAGQGRRSESSTEGEMAYLYITQPGGTLRKSGDRFLLEADGSIVLDVPYHRLEHILVFGNIQITSQAMAEALDHGIALSLFSRQGRYRGVLQPPVGKNVLLRMEQYRLYAEEAAALEAGRACLRAKLENSLAVLHRCRTRRPLEGSNQLVYEEGRGQTEEALQGLASVGSVPELLGYEGSGAKGYFAALMQFQRSEFEWPGRKKHPAPDPLNALLSLGYTLLMNELSALVQAHGIDPGLGFLHEIDGSRPSLALDLMEPFRAAMVDRFTLHYVNRRRCRAEDFEKRQNSEGLFLKPDELREYLAAYERWMLASVGALAEGKVVNFRSVLRGEVDRYIAFLGGRRKGVVWEPFVVRTLWQDGEGEAEGGEEGAVAG